MPKICEMKGVRQYGNSDPVELWRDDESGRLVIKAFNEGGYSCTDVDLWDLINWLQTGSRNGALLVDAKDTITVRFGTGGHSESD